MEAEIRHFTPEQIAQLQALARARGDVAFSRYVESMFSRECRFRHLM
jgi:hypothetical protein